MAPKTKPEDEALQPPTIPPANPQEQPPAPEQPPAQVAQPSEVQPPAPVSAQPPPPPTTPAPAPQPVQPPAPTPQQFGPQAQQLQQPVSQPKTTVSTPVTSFTRLQDYLRTGQPQAQGLGSTLQSQIQNQAATGRQALGQAAQSFTQQVETAGKTTDEQRVNDLIERAAHLKPGESLTDAEFQELFDVASKKEGFAGAAPGDLTHTDQFADALKNLSEAKAKAALTGQTGGLQALLSDIFSPAEKQYTSGQSLLDAILTGSSKAPATALTGLRDEYVTKDVLTKEQQDALDATDKLRSEKEAALNTEFGNISSKVGTKADEGLIGNMEKTIKNRITVKNEQVEKVNKLIANVTSDPANIVNFGSTTGDKELIATLHLTNSQVALIRQTGGRDPSIFNLLKELNEQTGTTKEEYSQLQALYKIGEKFGRTQTRLVGEDMGDVGSLTDQQGSVDWERVQNDVQRNAEEANRTRQDSIFKSLAVPMDDYEHGRGSTVHDAAIDIYDRMRTGSFKPVEDNADADRVLTRMQTMAQSVASEYAKRGLTYDMGRFNPTDEDIFGEKGTFRALIEHSGVGQWNPNMNFGSRTRNKSMPQILAEMKEWDPNLLRDITESARRMAQIKRYAMAFDFFNSFRHIQK